MRERVPRVEHLFLGGLTSLGICREKNATQGKADPRVIKLSHPIPIYPNKISALKSIVQIHTKTDIEPVI